MPTVADRVVQASLKLVLEPVFEAEFLPCSYGFRPNRRAHDAIAETRYLASHGYEWVVEGDITACFDEISHPALMERVRNRIGDKRVLSLVKAFLKSGILSRDGAFTDTRTGTPQGGILSPLLANIALSVLDEHIAQAPGGPDSTSEDRRRRRHRGLPNYRLVRYADDFLVLVFGRREHAEELRDEVAEALKPMGLRLSVEKTKITHIDEGLDFLGWRIQRQRAALPVGGEMDLAGLSATRASKQCGLQSDSAPATDASALFPRGAVPGGLPVSSFWAAPFCRAFSSSATAFSRAVRTSSSRCIPAASWWARATVESTLTSERSTSSRVAASAIRPSSRASKTPASRHWRKRL